MCLCVRVCVCVCASLSSHLLMDTWIGFISLNNACMNTGVLVSFSVSVFLLFRYIPRNGIARLHDSSFFSFFRNLNTVSTPAILIYTATNTVWGFRFLYSLANPSYYLTGMVFWSYNWIETLHIHTQPYKHLYNHWHRHTHKTMSMPSCTHL